MITLHKFKKVIIGESLTSQIDNSTQLFTTTYNFNPDKLQIYVNGQRLAKDVDFEVTGSDEFEIIHYIPKLGFILIVDYERA